MARVAQCPSCGAAVTFRSVVSVLAVCEYCQTTLLDRNGEIENLGKMAALAEDRSPLRLGSEGRWGEKHFIVIGRLQLKYEQGLWSEWFLLFDDHRTAWLSEAAGEYALFFPQSASIPLPAFSTLNPGDEVTLEAEQPAEWIVTDIERAECVAGEGELPFKVGSGYPAPVVDLRVDSRMATLDYSEGEDAPLLFVGNVVDFSSLNWTNLRQDASLPAEPNVKAKALRCADCGAPLEIKHEGILAVACARCGAVTDAKTQKLLSALKSAHRITPKIPLGAVGKFRGEKLEVIGFMQRFMTAEGQRYDWREYLLARVDKPGYRWLTEYDGHWNIADVVNNMTKKSGKANTTYQGTTFRHFQTYTAKVDFVVGEFTWRVKTGEKTHLTDYIAPPKMLSNEQTASEISWSLSEYVKAGEIARAFNLKVALPRPKGIYANQPSPWKARSRPALKTALYFFIAAFVLQLVFRITFSSPVYVRENFQLLKESETRISSPFTITKPVSLRVVGEASGLENSWVELGLWLVNEQDGDARAGTTELSYYSGQDSDGYWVENDQRKALVFRDIPAGTWRLMVEPALDPHAKAAKRPEVSLSVTKAPAPWSNLLIFLFALQVWPLVIFWRTHSFEAARWEESDH